MKLAGAYIHDDKYERLVALAESNNRTLAGQCRHLFDRALNGELQVPAHSPATNGDKAAALPEPMTARPLGDAEAAEEQRVPAADLPKKSPGVRAKRSAMGSATVTTEGRTTRTIAKEAAR